jgi:D-glycero-alpha-D-manno-heptose-7-phosphate kinase
MPFNHFWNVLTQRRDLRELGDLFHEGWECKKQLAEGISNSRIDECYERARRAGALGGKVLGAGESGFLLLFCEPRMQGSVRGRLADLREISFKYEPEGSKIIYVGGLIKPVLSTG